MEGYILGGRNIAEQEFKAKFKRIHGNRELAVLEKEFRKRFIREEDLRLISSWGANCVRLPVHYKIFEKKPYVYNKESLTFLRRILRWADKYKLKVILDLHAACGAQNCDWHADSTGKALLWRHKRNRDRTCALWRYLAENLASERALYGYDVLNEPVIAKGRVGELKTFYKDVITSIRSVDKKSVIFLEGNTWAQDIDFLKDLIAENIAVSIHFYEPLEFTFNFRRGYTYPGAINGGPWNKERIRRRLSRYKDFSSKYGVSVFVGEFGVNYRGNRYGELRWLDDALSVFREFGFSWTYWTYKAVSSGIFPDGIVQYLDNSPWVKREGPVYGLENLYTAWPAYKNKIVSSWNTKHFQVNHDIVKGLKKHFKHR